MDFDTNCATPTQVESSSSPALVVSGVPIFLGFIGDLLGGYRGNIMDLKLIDFHLNNMMTLIFIQII